MLIKYCVKSGLRNCWKTAPYLFSSQKVEGGYGIKFDEKSIKKKIEEIKGRDDNQQGKQQKKPQFLKNYKINKVRSETKKFRQQTQTENLFQIEDVTLDQKPTALQVTSFSQEEIEVDEFAYPPSLILTPNQALIWEIQSIKQVKVQHFKLIEVLNPPPTYIILGCKDPKQVPQQINEYFQKLKVDFDILPLFEAVSNYNTYGMDEVPLIAFFNSK